MNTYFVSFTLHNWKNGGWAFKIVNRFDDIVKAKKEYHSQLSTYIGSADFDMVTVTLYDAFGNVLQNENWTQPVAESEETVEA